jgi:RES domain-containing protein
MVYTSEHVSLALLEMIVHADSSLMANYVVIPVSFEESLVTSIDPSTLPNDWRQYPSPFALKKIGDDWLEARSSPVLRVPSAIVPGEWNYLINPEHEKFKIIVVGKDVDLEVDVRLLRQSD